VSALLPIQPKPVPQPLAAGAPEPALEPHSQARSIELELQAQELPRLPDPAAQRAARLR
jgi:hypothetical protein